MTPRRRFVFSLPDAKRRLLLGLFAAVLLVLPSRNAAAQQVIGLGNGLKLEYQSGDLDPVTLAGSAEDVRLFVDNYPAAAMGRLRLDTRGALIDSDFTILTLEAFDVVSGDGKAKVEEVTGRDVPIGSLRLIAMEMDRHGDDMAPPQLLGLLRRISLGSLTLRGISVEDGALKASVRRAAIREVGEARIGLVEIDNVLINDRSENITASLRSGQITNISLDPRFYPGLRFESLSVLSDEVHAALASLELVQSVGTLQDGTTYPERQKLALRDLTIQPGPEPDPDFREMFEIIGEAGLKLQVDSISSMAPQGANFTIDTRTEAKLQTGDRLNLDIGLQLPIASWQFLSTAIDKDPASMMNPELSMQMLLNMSLAGAEISVTTGKLAEAAVVAISSEEGMTPEALRRKAADDATGVMLALPPSTKPYRDAIEAFILNSGTLKLAVAPAFPMPLNSFMVANSQPELLIEKLNISVTHTPHVQ